MNPAGQICTMVKEGPGGFDPSSLGDMLETAQSAAKDIFARMAVLMKQQNPTDQPFAEFIR